MTATAQDIGPIWAGDTIDIEVTVLDSETGDPKNLAGATVRWVLHNRYTGAALLEKSTGDGIAVTDASGGVFVVSLDPTDTADLAGIYGHEAKVTDSEGNVSTVTVGAARIRKSRVQ